MPKKSINDIVGLYKKAVTDTAAARKSGWGAENSESVALQLIKAQSDSEGKEVKLSAERLGRITAAMQITPRRVVQSIKSELKAAGAELDDNSESFLLDLFDIVKFRKELIGADLVKPSGKGREKKQSLKDLFAS